MVGTTDCLHLGCAVVKHDRESRYIGLGVNGI